MVNIMKRTKTKLEKNVSLEKEQSEVNFKRFTFNQLAQHWVMIATFMILVVTGMPVKFPDSWWSPVIIISGVW